MGKKTLPSTTAQRRALKKRGIDAKKLSTWTTYRLYNYYIRQKNPTSHPRALAYGEHKRFLKILEKDGKQKFITGTGKKITVQTFLRRYDRFSSRRMRKELQPTITAVKTNHRFKSGKLEDRFRYVFSPDGASSGLIVTKENIQSILYRMQSVHIPEIMEAVNTLFQHRGTYFYQNRVVGALIVYSARNMPGDEFPRPVKFVPKSEFSSYLYDMIRELLVTDIFRHYKDAIVLFHYIDVFIRTKTTPTVLEDYV